MRRLETFLVLALLAPSFAQAQTTSDAADPAEEEEEAAPPPSASTASERPPPPTSGATPRPEPAPARSSAPPPRAAGTANAPALPQPAAREEEEEEEEDGGDPYDFLWIDLAAAVSYVDMRALDSSNYYPEFVRLSGIGPAGVLGLGFRIEFIAVGVRATYASYGDGFDVGTATGEITLMLPIPIVKPWFRAGFGFGWHGDGNFDAPTDSQTTVFGFAFNGAAGLDIYLAEWFSIGAGLSVDVLNMNRQRYNGTMSIDPSMAGEVRFEETGDAVGIQIRGQAGVTFHL